MSEFDKFLKISTIEKQKLMNKWSIVNWAKKKKTKKKIENNDKRNDLLKF